MSIELDSSPNGAPELTELGKRVEMLRIERGLSKQHLARDVGASRQQLWRVMTGKSELTSSLRHRIADALRVDPSALTPSAASSISRSTLGEEPHATLQYDREPSTHSVGPAAHVPAAGPAPLADFLMDPARIERALFTLPSGAEGRRLKRALLNELENLAMERGLVLDSRFFDLRRRVLSQDL